MKSFEPVVKQAQPHLSPEKDKEPTVRAADAVEQSNLFNIGEKGKEKMRKLQDCPLADGAIHPLHRPGFSTTKVMSSLCFLSSKDNGGIPVRQVRKLVG